jgi:hypothetical protein
VHIIEIHYIKGIPSKPLSNPFYKVDRNEIKEMLSNAIILIFLTTVFPALYITLLTMATYTLARLLERGAR